MSAPSTDSTGFLLVNLGTPSAPTAEAVRAFLAPFLGDRRVIDLPRWLWLPVLHGIILRTRPPRVAEGYRTLWQHWGDSPLRVITERQVAALRNRLAPGTPVAHAFTYGEPSIAGVLERWHADGIRRAVILPLYPQFSWTTTGSVLDQVAACRRRLPTLVCEVIESYAVDAHYLDALAASVREFWQQHQAAERLLMSFHGVPQRYVNQGDPYQAQCLQTAKGLALRLGLAPERFAAAFQSRFGRAEWIKPYTVNMLRQWGNAGIKTVDVICPSFAADCLETLEEITTECADAFREAGGDRLRLIPCLNDRADHVQMMQALLAERG